MNTYIDIWSCQSSDLGTLQHYCTMLCGYFHSGHETRAHLSDCVNEQYRGLRAIYVCNRHGWLRAVSEYNSGSVCGSLLWTSTEHRLRTAGFRLLYFFKFQKCCFYVYCSALIILTRPLTGCLYRHIAIVRVSAPFWGGGGGSKKYFIFLISEYKKHHLKVFIR